MIKVLFPILAISLLAFTAKAETTMFGVTIGGTVQLCDANAKERETCIKKDILGRDGIYDLHTKKILPDYVIGYPSVKFINNKVVGIKFLTRGIKYQTEIYNSLARKFGSPKNKKVVNMRTLSGVTHKVIESEWRLRDKTEISFIGASGDIFTGGVIIGNPISEMYEKNEREAM